MVGGEAGGGVGTIEGGREGIVARCVGYMRADSWWVGRRREGDGAGRAAGWRGLDG